MMSEEKDELFVETTIHIWRITCSRSTKRRIDNVLAQRKTVSSTYVKAEYINTIVRATASLYNVVVDSEDLIDAKGRWQNTFGSQYKLGVSVLLDVLLAGIPDGELGKEMALLRLRQMIDVTLMGWFENGAKRIIDPTNCDSAKSYPTFNGITYELPNEFPPKRAPQGLCQFLSAHAELLIDLRESITSKARHWSTVAEGIKRMIVGDFALTRNHWCKLSDVVIALEAKASDCTIYTGNVIHFKPICESINLSMVEEYPQ